MNIKSLALSLAVAASAGSSAIAQNLVQNGQLEQSGYAAGSTVDILDPAPGAITFWTVHGSVATPTQWNSIYIFDSAIGAPPPSPMPDSYVNCLSGNNPGQGFQPGAVCANPDGAGHFINLDGDSAFAAAISQSIASLVNGGRYELTFSWSAVQRTDGFGETTDNFLDVSLGSFNAHTSLIDLPEHGFSGWFTSTYDFTWSGV